MPRCTAIAEIRLALRAWGPVRTTFSPPTFVVHRPTESWLLVAACREMPYQTPPTTRASGTTTAAVRRRTPITGTSVGVQRLVEGDAAGPPRHDLDGARHRVATEEQVATARQVHRLHDAPVRESDLRTGGDVAPGLPDAVVAERDADPGVRAEQAALADRHHLRAAPRQGAHDRGAAAHVGPVTDHHTGGDPPLHHGRAEGPGVVVDEALVHDRRTRGQVGAEADAVAVRDAYAVRHHVVGHPRELVDAEDLERSLGAKPQATGLEVVDRAGPGTGPDHVGQDAED